MIWEPLVNDKPKKKFLELIELYAGKLQTFDLSSKDREFSDVREAFLQFDTEATEASEGERNKAYVYDLEFALRMYKYLSEHDFGIWQAAENGVWARLGICVIPDIVHKRLGGFNEERFYKRNWRIWLKDLWWYVYLTESDETAQFDMDETRNLLINGSQDIMFLLLDHSSGGFRPGVYHALMKHYASVLSEGKVKEGREGFFRSVMLEHQIRSMVVDPILESEDVYVSELFDRVVTKYENGGRQ